MVCFELHLNTVCVVGGVDIEKQKEELQNGTHVLVATPGRLKDLMLQNIVTLEDTHGIVFDEA